MLETEAVVDVELYLLTGGTLVLRDVPEGIALDILNSVGTEDGEDSPEIEELGCCLTITWNPDNVVAAVVRAE